MPKISSIHAAVGHNSRLSHTERRTDVRTMTIYTTFIHLQAVDIYKKQKENTQTKDLKYQARQTDSADSSLSTRSEKHWHKKLSADKYLHKNFDFLLLTIEFNDSRPNPKNDMHS